MIKFNQLFKSIKCPVIGMIHVKALPGTPRYSYQDNFQSIVTAALEEAQVFKSLNLDGVILENMHDIPYVQDKDIGPEIVASMTRIAGEIRKVLPKIPIGLQILACGNKQAVAVAKATHLQFIRAEGFVFGHLADEGYTNACAGDLLRYRRQIDADDVLVLTDIKKKHSSHSITGDVSLVETANAAEFFLSDGLIITGSATGSPADVDELKALQGRTKLPILIGSGVTLENLINYFYKSNGVIVGSYFKDKGSWDADLDYKRVSLFMEKVKELRKKSS